MANIFQKFFQKKAEPQVEVEKQETRDITSIETNPITGEIKYNTSTDYSNSQATKLSTVFRCMNLLSDSLAELPMIPYRKIGGWNYPDDNNNLNYLLNIQPNDYQSAFMFKKMAVVNCLGKGNTYIAIEKNNNGDNLSLTLLNSDYVYIYVNGTLITNVTNLTTLLANDNLNIQYNYLLNGRMYDKSQIIHIPNYCKDDGIVGISTIQYAADALGIAYNTNKNSDNFFKGGANLSGTLSPKAGAQMLQGQAQKAKADFIAQTSPVFGGVGGGIVALDAGLEYTPIGVSPVQSQMLENKAFNVLEICRFYGVPPSLAFSETAKYSTAEQQSLDFLNNGLLPLIEKFENEFKRKLYLKSDWLKTDLKFDVENILRLDATTKADTMVKLVGIGAKTPNEARQAYNAKFPVQGGNKAFISTNLQTLDNPIVKGDAPVTGASASGSTSQNNNINNNN